MWGPEAAKDSFGFDEAYDINNIDDILPELIRGNETLYALVGKNIDFDQKLLIGLIQLILRKDIKATLI